MHKFSFLLTHPWYPAHSMRFPPRIIAAAPKARCYLRPRLASHQPLAFRTIIVVLPRYVLLLSLVPSHDAPRFAESFRCFVKRKVHRDATSGFSEVCVGSGVDAVGPVVREVVRPGRVGHEVLRIAESFSERLIFPAAGLLRLGTGERNFKLRIGSHRDMV